MSDGITDLVTNFWWRFTETIEERRKCNEREKKKTFIKGKKRLKQVMCQTNTNSPRESKSSILIDSCVYKESKMDIRERERERERERPMKSKRR